MQGIGGTAPDSTMASVAFRPAISPQAHSIVETVRNEHSELQLSWGGSVRNYAALGF